MAFPRWERSSTISTKNAWRVGMSTALINPSSPASATSCQTVTRPVKAKTVSTVAWIMAADCVISTVRRRFQRSVNTPARGLTANTGIWAANSTRPKSHGDPLKR